MSSFSNEELEEFKNEACELLDTAEQSLLSISTGNAPFEKVFDSIFRCFHNLKGASGMMELTDLQHHVHELETILMPFKVQPTIPGQYVDLFLRGIDGARQILSGNKISFAYTVEAQNVTLPLPKNFPVDDDIVKSNSSDTISTSDKREFFQECEELIDKSFISMNSLSSLSSKEEIESLYRDIHSLKGALFLFSYNDAGVLAHEMESQLDLLREGSVSISPELNDQLFESIKKIELMLFPDKNQTVPVEVETMSVNLSPQEQVLNPQFAQVDVKAAHDEKDSEANSSIRVPVSVLDSLMTLVGEMVLVRNQVIQFSNQTENLDFLNLSKRLNVVTNEIQGEIMKTRMQPIGNVLNKFTRVVRDLSKELKKEITLHLSGIETELDKTLLEAIKDPLMHIVRNACDHGIEETEERKRKSKDKVGNIWVNAYHEGGQVIIEIKDDGKGLNKEILIKKAIEKNILSSAQAVQLSEQDAFNLIFAPGFSTASSITNVSGRGVGMDVVRTNVERIGGNVELESTYGSGTTIKLKIPLTLAIVPALIVKCSGDMFAIPQVKLDELVRVDTASDENKIEYLHDAPVYRLRGNILPLVNLNQVLKNNKTEIKNAIFNIAVVKAENCSFGLIVDEVIDTGDIVVKPLNKLLKSLQIYSGATILGDGSVALILDIVGISKKQGLGVGGEEKNSAIGELKSNVRTKDYQDYLYVRLSTSTMHAILLNDVYRLENFAKERLEKTKSGSVVRYGEKILPLILLNEFFEYEANEFSLDQVPVVVVEKSGSLYGLVVSEIVDTVSIETPVFSGALKNKGSFGELNLSDRIVTVIDSFEIIREIFPDISNVNLEHDSLSTKHLKILLVEDSPLFRREISKILDRAGHTVVTASDGQEAIETLNSDSSFFDVVISDIEMPRMNGFELAKQIKENPKLRSIPLLAVSSKSDQKHVEKGLKSGFDVYLEKLQADVLLSAVNKITKEAA